ncbi:acyltransferase family protein [Methanospirillum lacunae]|uniref:Acyltransferase 3 domain-containing protein n=1 Tax=Methanospirillum lacunae TaxID=668570 RepID=A0A2V2N8Z0_9EURY|nr:acyltransferase family protein [Methanospirillum lacunae]PWR72767.1 hypothetical protein DK846_07395 [Methanospirillum lacunae]
MNNRIISIDFLRTLAICFIVITHCGGGYIINNGGIKLFSPYFASFGLGLFIFISGYILFTTTNLIKTKAQIIKFYKKRIIRIFPLYWIFGISLFFFVYATLMPIFAPTRIDYNISNLFNFYNLIINALGLQIILSPALAKPIFTLYFVGLILFFYLLYPLIIYFSKKLPSFIIVTISIFVSCLMIRILFHLIDDYFFNYFFIFVCGIATNFINLFENQKWRKYLLIIPTIFGFGLILNVRMDQILPLFQGQYLSISIVSTISLNIIVISFCLISLWFAESFIGEISPNLNKLFLFISTSSFVVYLIHRPFFTIWYGIFYFLGFNPLFQDIIMIIFIIPITFVIGYYIQKIEENWRNKYA